MNFFKNVEIASKYNISQATVVKWIQDSNSNKNNLQLITYNKKLRVIDNEHNHAELTRLSLEGQKFRTTSSFIKTQPHPDFYKIFDIEEQIEIINDLRYRKEVNLKFYYKNGGAQMWDEDYKTSGSEMLTAAQSMLNISIDDLSYLTQNKRINLIDMGCGNGHHAKILIDQFQLSKYIAIDISNEMLELCKNNILSWQPQLDFSKYVCDIESSRFGKIFLDNHDKDILNLVLFIGGTICNTNDRVRILKNFASGLLADDVLVFNYSLDSVKSRSEFNLARIGEEGVARAWIITTLGIDVENCEVEVAFDPVEKCKIKSLILDKDYNISFQLNGKVEEVNLKKGEKITRWKHFLLTHDLVFNEIQQANLEVQFMKVVGDHSLIAVKQKT
ncbi:MAG: L-histidine N(alpha)-methyltransferase [Patescibacteria group bacterium]